MVNVSFIMLPQGDIQVIINLPLTLEAITLHLRNSLLIEELYHKVLPNLSDSYAVYFKYHGTEGIEMRCLTVVLLETETMFRFNHWGSSLNILFYLCNNFISLNFPIPI